MPQCTKFLLQRWPTKPQRRSYRCTGKLSLGFCNGFIVNTNFPWWYRQCHHYCIDMAWSDIYWCGHFTCLKVQHFFYWLFPLKIWCHWYKIHVNSEIRMFQLSLVRCTDVPKIIYPASLIATPFILAEHECISQRPHCIEDFHLFATPLTLMLWAKNGTYSWPNYFLAHGQPMLMIN